MKTYPTIACLRASLVQGGLLVIFVFLFISAGHPQKKETSSSERQEAEKAWDALIRMKGGRAKLQSLKSMLTEFPNSGRFCLDVLPDRQWTFEYDFSGSPAADIVDGVNSVQYYSNENGVVDTRHDDLTDWFPRQYLPMLLETKWNLPEIVRVYQIKDGKLKLEVIETIVGKRRIDFIYEPEEMLVRKVKEYDKQGVVWQIYSFSNYVEIDGIKMPTKWDTAHGYKPGDLDKFVSRNVKFTFNVDYAPDLFTRPLKATTHDAWKRKP